MKVYYSNGLGGRGKGLWGRTQWTNWEFEYAGEKCYIPAIYRFSKGVVFDVITLLDEAKLREFFDKYEAVEETLTPLHQRCAKQEHPYQAVRLSEISINGKQVDAGYSSSGAMSISWLQQGDKPVLTSVKKAYSSILKGVTCFACERFCVPFPPADSKYQGLLRYLRLDKVSRLKLSTYPVKRFLPLDIHFDMSIDEKPKEISFGHPVTKTKHTLYLHGSNFSELPIRADENSNLYIMQSMYEIEPVLPLGDTLQFDSSIQYTQIKEILDNKFCPTAASAIGIIGGSDGPTSIYISSKGKAKTVPVGLHGLPLYSCYSVLSSKNEGTAHFVLEGININERGSEEYDLR